MSLSPEFDLTIEAEADGIVVRVRGELDSGTCPALQAAGRDALARPALGQLTLDLNGVSFVDSAGMRTMILLEQLAGEKGVSIVVWPPPEEVMSPLHTAGVADRMTFGARPSRLGSRADHDEPIELELPSEPMSPSRARAEVRELMAGRQSAADVANLVLLTSEVVTNAVVHPRVPAPATIVLRIVSHENGVRVEVEDGGDGFDPDALPESPQAGGRGLFLVDSCAASWGTGRVERARGRRFCVWFELEWTPQPVAAG